MMFRRVQYGFPEAVMEPDQEVSVKVDLNGPFRAERLFTYAMWNVIRGSFKLKRSRLPLINREEVEYAATRVYRGRRGNKRWFRPGKTTVRVCATNEHKAFEREYLPSSVIYIPTEPLHFIVLRQLFVGTAAQLANVVSAGFFAVGGFGNQRFGNQLSLPTESVSIVLVLKNIGDVQIKVRAMMLGAG